MCTGNTPAVGTYSPETLCPILFGNGWPGWVKSNHSPVDVQVMIEDVVIAGFAVEVEV